MKMKLTIVAIYFSLLFSILCLIHNTHINTDTSIEPYDLIFDFDEF